MTNTKKELHQSQAFKSSLNLIKKSSLNNLHPNESLKVK